MAFDAGMLCAVVIELNTVLGKDNMQNGSKVEKIYMPEKDEIHLVLRTYSASYRLVLSASPNNARILISESSKENPPTPPSLCMLLRKKLSGAVISKISQSGFERVCTIEFDTKDEMGFSSKKYLVCEIMGKYSNIIFCDDKMKILGAVRTVDATSSLTRRIIPGTQYALPPSQNKLNPTTVTQDEFYKKLESFEPSFISDKAITLSFCGIAPLVSAEICYRASGDVSVELGKIQLSRLWEEFSKYISFLKKGEFSPCLLFENGKDTAFEYSVYPILHYEDKIKTLETESVSQMIERFFSLRDKNDRQRQKSHDIFKVLTNAKNRLIKKTEVQTQELSDCEDMEECRAFADLIIQEMYRIKRGDLSVEAVDYSSEPYKTVKIPLDSRLSPSQNAQRYYKKYNRKKNAKKILTSQIEQSKKEIEYIDTVFDALSRAEKEKELSEIREELSLWGYIKRDAKKLRSSEKKKDFKPAVFLSPSGYEIYVGKNNLQNDYITTKLSEKNDWWFHVKNQPGSHVLMKVGTKEEPPAEDFTFACTLAAKNSSVQGDNTAVDYTMIKYVKKPLGSKPGFVTYTTHWTAFVSPKDNITL